MTLSPDATGAGVTARRRSCFTSENPRRTLSFKTPLLLDEGGKVSRAYDALMPIPIINIVNRTVVGIDRQGTVRFYERGMPSTSTILSAMGAQGVEA